MKHLIMFVAFIFLTGFFSFSQSYNSELLKSYTKKELQNFDSETIKALEYGIENAVYYTQIPEEKNAQLAEIELSGKLVKFTDIGLKINNETQYFSVKGTDQMLVVKSINILKLQMKNPK